MKQLTTLCLCFTLIAAIDSCNTKRSFYDYYAREDLYRIPLIEPYELINLYNANPDLKATHGWELDFIDEKAKGHDSHVNVSNINVINGIIYGHGQDGMTDYPNFWFVVIPSEKVSKTFKEEGSWLEYLKTKQINGNDLYEVWPLFNKFKEKLTLPWRKADSLRTT